MSLHIRSLLTFLCIAAALVCYAAVTYFPAFPKSIVGWLSLIVIGVPSLFLFEWMGAKALSFNFFKRISSAARVAIAIPGCLLVLVLVVWLANIVSTLIVR